MAKATFKKKKRSKRWRGFPPDGMFIYLGVLQVHFGAQGLGVLKKTSEHQHFRSRDKPSLHRMVMVLLPTAALSAEGDSSPLPSGLLFPP
jgi:hypothetical protein